MEKFFKWLILKVILACVSVSGSFSNRGVCRFVPSCSEYAISAAKNCSPIKAVILIAWRILRCNPLCKGGLDPAPTN